MKKLIGALAISTTLLIAPSAHAQDVDLHPCPYGKPVAVSAACGNPSNHSVTCIVWVYVYPLKRAEGDEICVSTARV